MNTLDLKKQIKDGTLDNIYIFTGPEIAVRNLYIEQMAKVANLEVRHVDALSDILKNISTQSLLLKSFLSVIVDDTSILSTDTLQRVISRASVLKNDIIVIVLNNIDKRTSFYKTYQDRIVEFAYLTPSTLKKYVQKDLPLTEHNCDVLIEVCERDYNRILLEIDKIKLFGGDANNTFVKLLNDGTIYQPARDAIFMFIDAVFMRQKAKAYSLLQECYDCGEATLVIISNLFTNAKYTLQVQSYRGDNLSQASGLSAFQIRLGKQRMGKYSLDELKSAMEVIRNTEIGIKTGKIEDDVAVKYILAKMLG